VPFDRLRNSLAGRNTAPVLVFLMAVLLPLLLGLDFRTVAKSSVIPYRLIWHYFASGSHPPYLITETPKPLICLLCHLLPHWGFYILVSLSVAFTCRFLGDLSEHASGRRYYGYLAFIYFIMVYRDSLQDLLNGYYLWIYLASTLGSLTCLLRGRLAAYSCLMLASSLIRPESWMYAAALPFLRLRQKTAWRNPLAWIPLMAPLLWLAFDYRAFGRPFYSMDVTARYSALLGYSPPGVLAYLREMLSGLLSAVGPAILVSAAACFWLLFFGSARETKPRLLALAAAALLPLVFYLVAPFFSEIVFMERFIIVPIVLAVLAAFMLPHPLTRKWPPAAKLAPVVFAALFILGFSPKTPVLAVKNARQELARTAVVEMTAPRLRRYSDSLNAYIIVPHRRKMLIDYRLGPAYSRNILSFRDIVYNHVFHHVDLSLYHPAAALYIDNDLAGLERGFQFLANRRVHHLLDYLAMVPLASEPGYAIYSLELVSVWSPPMQLDIMGGE